MVSGTRFVNDSFQLVQRLPILPDFVANRIKHRQCPHGQPGSCVSSVSFHSYDMIGLTPTGVVVQGYSNPQMTKK